MVAEQLSRIISGDTHLEIDWNLFRAHVPEQYRERAPRIIRLDSGADAWSVEGAPVQEIMFSLWSREDPTTFNPFGQTIEGSAGAGGPKQRLAEQDMDHIDAEVLYPGVSGPKFWRNIRDDVPYRAVVHAYNEYLAEDFCSVDPNRLIGVGTLPWTGVSDAVNEMKYCKDHGLRAVCLSVFPNGTGAPTREDDEFWAAAKDLEMPITVHTEMYRDNGGDLPKLGRMANTSEAAIRKLPNHLFVSNHCAKFGFNGGINVIQMAMNGVFDRFPELRVFFAETGIGWIPYWMQTADMYFLRHKQWTERVLGWKPPKELPSYYARRHCLWGFEDDVFGIEHREIIGVENLIWASDFPHQESDWPHSLSVIDRTLEGVPIDEVKLITSGNVSNFFQLD
jgi:predicted TIM-barrel fold metal-dependent hydrolase